MGGLVLTLNHREHLDEALIRPGRADMKIELPNVDRQIAARIFCGILKRLKHGIPDPNSPREDDDTVKLLAAKFAKKVPEGEFPPAVVQY